MSFWTGKSVLITGGTGSLGTALVPDLLARDVRRLVVFSRDEAKQHEMQARWPEEDGGPMRYLIGHVQDRDRLRRAFHGIEIVLHAAALKQVLVCERDPIEAISTNVIGTRNVIEAAIDESVSRVMVVSSDKAVAPCLLYGATKLCAERLAVAANAYAGAGPTRISAVRYGNVVGSRGSVLHVWRQQAASGTIDLTDPESTRFWIGVPDAARFVLGCVEAMGGREVFVPRLSASRVEDLATAVAPEADRRMIGLRAGEKRHEVLISPDEVDRAWCFATPDASVSGYVLWPTSDAPVGVPYVVNRVSPDFVYSSDRAPCLSVEALRRMVEAVP